MILQPGRFVVGIDQSQSPFGRVHGAFQLQATVVVTIVHQRPSAGQITLQSRLGAQRLKSARAQIDGRFGYLRGYNGLPQINGVPIPDRYGEPVICSWMIGQGFGDMRGLPNPYPTPGGTTVPMLQIP